MKSSTGVSIHALLAECDKLRMLKYSRFPLFQSTHSLRSATVKPTEAIAAGCSFNPRTPCGVRPGCRWTRRQGLSVSIHALLAECDCGYFRKRLTLRSFNPRTPCGVRPRLRLLLSLQKRFQSTHSLRSATRHFRGGVFCPAVSIHALLAECDPVFPVCNDCKLSFNPRTPCGVRPSTAPIYRGR